MAAQLTKNFIEALYKNQFESFGNPIVQVLNIKSTQSNTNRVIISDGIYFMQTLMSSQLMEQSSKVSKNCLIKIKKCISNRLSKNGVVSIFGILLDFDVLPYENLDKIGNPRNIQEVFPPQTIMGYDNSSNPSQGQSEQNNKPNNFNNIKNNNNNNNNSNNNNMKNQNIFPIKSLSPYQNRWTIRAKVISKNDIKTWNNARGSGKLFSTVFMDNSSEIRATAFNDACDKFYDLLQEDQVYYISGANIKVANKQFNNVKNEYEMYLDANTNITLCNDSNQELKMHYSFIPINQLEAIDKDSIVDVIGVVDQMGEIVQITSKASNRPINKRDVYIVDDSGFKVRLTLWAKHAEDMRYEDKPVVAFKAVKVNDFQGKSISTLSSSIISFNPDIPEAHRISGWYSQNNDGNYQTFSNMGSFNGGDVQKTNVYKTLQQIKNENLGSEKADYFNIVSTVVFIKKDNFAYPACPGENCNKKVIEEDDLWRCEKCNKSYPEPEYRYILSLDALDHTGNQWLTCFNESAEKLLGHKAKELQEIKNYDENEFNKIFDDVSFRQYDFRIRAKIDTYNEESRLRCNIIDVKPINFEIQIKNNIEAIDKLMNELQI
ncbi:replication factor-a protein [Piromyces finnis]|uniref:Replication protein A subunit n=1 Tax=Piromyces finnis TaxID=1754191 RepID=A0A1Y1VG03_9FUNG|nr:replication factor-a protein [Piromyces finnis]|eukprot:ORX55345.1 replication factor-a protein [Piromyces finnis]